MFRGWTKRITEVLKDTVVIKEKEAEEEKKGLLEYIWDHLPTAKLSGHTYVKFNEGLGKITGRENSISEISIDAESELTLANYTFLYSSNCSNCSKHNDLDFKTTQRNWHIERL